MSFSLAIFSHACPIDMPVVYSAIAGGTGTRSLGRNEAATPSFWPADFAFESAINLRAIDFDTWIGTLVSDSAPPARATLHCPVRSASAAEVMANPGTEQGDKAAIPDWLDGKGLASSEPAIENGAALSRHARITAADIGALLRSAWRQPYMPENLASMSLSGLDGTLSRRFRNTDLIGKAHLKTGSMDHVTAIAGYLQSRSGRRFAVVALQNHEDIHRGPGEEVQHALLRWLYEQ